MKNLPGGDVNAAQVGKGDSGADEGCLKAKLRTNLLALRELAVSMSTGIVCRNRKIGLKTFHNVFLGEDAMQWLISHSSCIASTDEEATEWGQLMIDHGFVKRVSKPHEDSPFGITKVVRTFKGGSCMYKFNHLRISPYKLHVGVRQAVDLQNVDVFGMGLYPYVVLELGEQRTETKTVNGSQRCSVWNELFMFGVMSVEAQQLRVSVYNHDTFISDRLIGYCQLSTSDLPIFDEDANQKRFTDDLLDVTNLDVGDRATAGISYVTSKSVKHETIRREILPLPSHRGGSKSLKYEAAVFSNVQVMDLDKKNKDQFNKCDNYATVQNGEDGEEQEQEMCPGTFLDDGSKHKTNRSTSSSEHPLPEDGLATTGEEYGTSCENRPTTAPGDVSCDTLLWHDLHGPRASGRGKYFGKIALELWLTSVEPQNLEAHGVIPIRIFLQIFSVSGVRSIEERSPLPIQLLNAKTRVVARVGDVSSTSKYYRKSKCLRSDYKGEIISIEGKMNPTTDKLRISVHQTTMDIGDKSIASVQIPLSTVAMDDEASEDDAPRRTMQLRALAGMMSARTITNGEICASLWMQWCFTGDPLGPEFVEDSNRTEGYDGPLPEQLENLCIDKEISCGFFRLRRALLRQDSALLRIYDEECGIIDRMQTGWTLPSGHPPNNFNNLETCERQESYIRPKTLLIKEFVCNATERVIIDSPDVCIWMVKTKTPEVPYGNLFTATNQIILVRTRPNRVRIRISSDLEFTQEPFIASQIRTAAAKGAKDSFVQLLTIIEASLLPARGEKGREKRKTAYDVELPWIHKAWFAFIIAAILCGMLFKFLPKSVEVA